LVGADTQVLSVVRTHRTEFCDAGRALERPGFLVFYQSMREFIRNTFSGQKLRQLCVNTALSNFVGFVAGSLVMILTTYESVERRAFKNLFGILPRETVVVHRLPGWLEWTLAVFLGYLVMELVRHIISSNRFLRLIDGSAREEANGNR
jgi:hypothetical protein